MGSHPEERDILGAVRVQAEARYGSFTTRARENFDISGLEIYEALIEHSCEPNLQIASRIAEEMRKG